MDVLLKWLEEYVNIEQSAEELCHLLTMAGLETNLKESEGPDLPGVLVAKIVKINRHPNAEKLTLCQVIVSEGGEPLPIVCGAPNIKEGDVVPLAMVGARLPGMVVEKAKIRGEVSFGMMCSAREMGISDDHSGIMILGPDTPLGWPAAEVLFARPVILETDPTPNRPDLLCALGVAREIAAITGQQVRYPAIIIPEEGQPIEDLARVDILDFEKCPRYVARLVLDVTVGDSPDWMKERLEASGIRAINNVVDVTNYVLLEMNQPLHAFDFDKLAEHRIVVRCAGEGEKFVTLDGKERALYSDTLMICDGAGPVAIAGIMGGQNSEVSEDTRRVLIESAYFDPIATRRTAKKLGLPTEASRRFERGIDPLGTLHAANRAAQLMAMLAGGKVCRGYCDVHRQLFTPPRIRLRPERLNAVNGINISGQQQKNLLSRLEMNVAEEGSDLMVCPPSYRQDIKEEIDLIEEAARLNGYENIEPAMPVFRMEPMRRKPEDDLARRMREMLKDNGFNEVINLNFDSPRLLDDYGLLQEDRPAVPIQNPLSELDSVMRYNLLPRLLDTAVYNISRGQSTLRLFELNRTFVKGDELPRETTMLSGLITRGKLKQLWSVECADDPFYELKGLIEQILEAIDFPGARLVKGSDHPALLPELSARLMLGADQAGSFGELRPEWMARLDISQKVFIFDLNFDMLCNCRRTGQECKPYSRYPSVVRDVAILVPESVTAEEVYKVIMGIKSPIIDRAEVFDIYRGKNITEGNKSMAFTIRYQSLERTLTDEEVNKVHEEVRGRIQKRLKAELR